VPSFAGKVLIQVKMGQRTVVTWESPDGLQSAPIYAIEDRLTMSFKYSLDSYEIAE
jgi:hypothetical protein